jgi:DNA modification methylase
MIVWDKGSAGMGARWTMQHELIAWGARVTSKTGKGCHGNVIQASRTRNALHPTEKPVWLPMKAIQNSTRPGEIVLVLFGGSGSTMIGADLTNRVSYTCELDPKFVDVIVRRWENLHPRETVEVIEP